MGAEDYLRAKNKSQRFIDTIQHEMVAGYLAAVNKLADNEGLLDFSKLEDGASVQEAADVLYRQLSEYARKACDSSSSDELTVARLVFSTFGLRKNDVVEYFKAGRGRSYTEFAQHLARNVPAHGYVLNMIGRDIPISYIGESDKEKEAVLDYIGIADQLVREKLRTRLNNASDMAHLIDEFDANNNELPKKTLEEMLKGSS